MAHEVGMRLKANILNHRIKVIGDKEAIELSCECEDGERVQALIWLSPKSAGIARQQLKLCGFDPDATAVDGLETNNELLAGRMITLDVEEYRNRLQYRIPTTSTPTKKRMRSLTEMLRSAKKSDEESPPVDPPVATPDDEDIPF